MTFMQLADKAISSKLFLSHGSKRKTGVKFFFISHHSPVLHNLNKTAT